MRILHYSLGFPPYRSGGLTKYCCDLMESQVERGHEVALVWPGSMFRRFGFKRRADWHGVASYEMRGPLPVPYDEGVLNPKAFMEARSAKKCEQFLKEFAPDVFHVHSTMGLPIELVERAKTLGVRTIFTTHDYYPLCPRVTLFHNDKPCDCESDCTACPGCNSGGLSMEKMRLLQSSIYRKAKDFSPVRALRAKHRSGAAAIGGRSAGHMPASSSEAYCDLLKRNISLLKLFDVIHANSKLTASVYAAKLPGADICIVPISNHETRGLGAGEYNVGDPIRIGYFGAPSAAKGYFLLLDALRSLWGEGLRFVLDLYGNFECDEPFARIHPRYDYKEIDTVYEATDLVVVPSLWLETFGFQATEALCRGVPIAISSNVGMKDILGKGMGVIFEPTSEACARALRSCLEPNCLAEMAAAILHGFVPPRLEDVEELYKRNVQY